MVKIITVTKMQILTSLQREWIEFFTNKGQGPREIGRFLRRDHTVISRELKRNTKPGKKYSAVAAQKLADFKSRKTNKRKLETNEPLHDYVVANLRDGWSPDEIAGSLRDHPPKTLTGSRISYEAIYDYIYNGEGRFEGLYHHLRKKHKVRVKKCARKKQKVVIPQRISIHNRPRVVEKRERVGDWETDTVQFKKQKTGLSVQYERRLMLARIHKINNKSALETEQAISETVESLPSVLFKTMTFDNGKEGVCHVKIRDSYGIETYFCDPYKSWQKGGVENLNGLIREYLPKGTNMDTITEEEVHEIQERLNNRPRKKLGYLSPNEALRVYIKQLTGALNS